MARPRKTGLDYFPHDTDSASDEKIEILRALYGNDGYAFYFILLERIYRTDNFELNIADVSEAETHQKPIRNDSEIVQILSKKLFVDAERFEMMLSTCLKHNIFSKVDYESKGVLTSEGIKKRAKPVTDKRAKMLESYKNKVSEAETPQKSGRNSSETPQSKGKKRIEKNINGAKPQASDGEKLKSKKFTPPTTKEITEYCSERKNEVDPQTFHDFYASKGWMIGKNKMRDWKAAVRTWERNGSSYSQHQPQMEYGELG